MHLHRPAGWLWLFAFLHGLIAAGQGHHFSFSHIDISRGLSNNQVTGFLRDQKGFLWIGTMAGLNRYDGYQFRVFRHQPDDSSSISDDYITKIIEGPGSKLWILTRDGFNIYDPVTERFHRAIDHELRQLGLPEGSLSDIVRTGTGDYLFLINQERVFKYAAKEHRSKLIWRAPAGMQIDAISLNARDEISILCQRGILTRIDQQTGKLVWQRNLPTNRFSREISSYQLFIDKDDDHWIFSPGTEEGVLRYNPGGNEFTKFSKDEGQPRLNNNVVVSVQQDNKGNIWICTDHGGVNVYSKSGNSIQYLIHSAEDEKSIAQNSITAAYKDPSGIIWIGTFKKGINYYHEDVIQFPLYRHQPGNPASLSFDDVNRFVEDAKGNLWIGTNGGGLIYFDRANNRFHQYLHQPGNSNSISNNVIVSLYIDRQQKLWIGSYFGGLDCLDNGTFVHYRHDPADPNSLSDDRVWEIFEDTRQNLWIGTLRGGLDRLDRTNGKFYHWNADHPNSLHSNYISAIIEDRQQKIWLGTDTGIDILDPGSGTVSHLQTNAPNGQGLSNNNVLTLYQDSRNLIWIGTRDGLNVYNPATKTMQSFRTENGLPGNTILNIAEDRTGHLWMSTKNGIARMTIEPQPAGASIRIKCVNYDELDGLQGTEFNENAALATTKGEILFGGANGFNLFQPREIAGDQTPPNLVFTGFQLFNKEISIGEKVNGRIILAENIGDTKQITLRYNENMLAIGFAALNFFNPEKIRYAYKLDGFNNDWLITDFRNRKAIYTNLDPGIYTFRLKATGTDGEWYDKDIQLRIRILPPFWQTPAAYAIYFIAAIALLWFARKIVVDRARMRFEMEQQRSEAERVQSLDAIKTKFFTNVSHEFRTPLSLILSPLDKLIKSSKDLEQQQQLQMVQRNGKRLLNLVNQLLDFRKMEVQEFNLHLSADDIVGFTHEIIQTFSDIAGNKDIKLDFSTDKEILVCCFDRDKMEKILFNLLSNAFKYTPQGGSVHVALHYENGENDGGGSSHILISVADTGIGIPGDMHERIFERYFQHDLPGNMHNYGTGIGLAITREFVRMHGGSISVTSEPEKGSCFTVMLPVASGRAGETGSIPGTSENTVSGHAITENDKENERPNHGRRHSILLVEDNEDFRFYLKDNLKHRFRVIEASNGSEAWDKILHHHPDLIVSDIMMPLMNGLQLSRKVRNDPQTSHIPIILLTAMTAVEMELEGFQAGANDYITKPFTFEILMSRIRSILQLHEQLRKKFQKLIDINPADITVTPLDQDFMKRALAVVESNMSNPDFSVEDLGRELFISRVALYKKILSLTGKTPIEFIRVMRLKRAAQLLQKSQMNVAGVAFEVGFNNPKLFARHFKTEFGTNPSEYRGGIQNAES